MVRCCIICPIAKSHIIISKNPKIGARNFLPLETKMILIVPSVISSTLAVKMSSGRMINENVSKLVILTMLVEFQDERKGENVAGNALSCDSDHNRLLSRNISSILISDCRHLLRFPAIPFILSSVSIASFSPTPLIRVTLGKCIEVYFSTSSASITFITPWSPIQMLRVLSNLILFL